MLTERVQVRLALAVTSPRGMTYLFEKKQEANILIRIPGDEKEVKGSLRFNYMIPVPQKCLKKMVINNVDDKKYRLLLYKEYKFCLNNSEKIHEKAKKNI